MTDEEFVAFLEAISVCFIKRDFAAWSRHTLLPLSLVTQQGPVTLYNLEALRQNFDFYLAAGDAMKLDQVLRFPLSLEDCGDGSFIGTYRTELLSKGKRQTAPYVASALIRFSGGYWRLSSIMNARGHHEWTGHSPQKTAPGT